MHTFWFLFLYVSKWDFSKCEFYTVTGDTSLKEKGVRHFCSLHAVYRYMKRMVCSLSDMSWKKSDHYAII